MRPVRREEIKDFVTYSEGRDAFRQEVMREKEPRRVHVGPHLTFLFETTKTIRYQVQEMMRAEQIVKEADIEHELATYNELLGAKGELGFTLLIEIDDEKTRNDKLKAYLGLPSKLYAKLDDGSQVWATFDERQVGDDRLSSVQYMKLDTRGRVPVAIGSDHLAYRHEALLTAAQQQALAEDVASDAG